MLRITAHNAAAGLGRGKRQAHPMSPSINNGNQFHQVEMPPLMPVSASLPALQLDIASDQREPDASLVSNLTV